MYLSNQLKPFETLTKHAQYFCIYGFSELAAWLSPLINCFSITTASFKTRNLFVWSSIKTFEVSIKTSQWGPLLLRGTIHCNSWYFWMKMFCILHTTYSQLTLSPTLVFLQYDFSPDNSGSKCWPKPESHGHFDLKCSPSYSCKERMGDLKHQTRFKLY